MGCLQHNILKTPRSDLKMRPWILLSILSQASDQNISRTHHAQPASFAAAQCRDFGSPCTLHLPSEKRRQQLRRLGVSLLPEPSERSRNSKLCFIHALKRCNRNCLRNPTSSELCCLCFILLLPLRLCEVGFKRKQHKNCLSMRVLCYALPSAGNAPKWFHWWHKNRKA